MPTSLRPKEETQYDDTRPGTQPNEAFDNIARMYDEPAYTNDRDPANKRARSPEDLRNAEANPRSSQDKPGLMEAKSLGEAAKLIPQGYIPGGAGGLAAKAFLKYFGSKNRRQGLIWGSITGVAITIALVGASFSSGPLELMHAGQILADSFWSQTEEIGDNQSARAMRSGAMRSLSSPENLRVNIVTAKWLQAVDTRLADKGIKATHTDTLRRGTGFDIDLSKRPDIARILNAEVDPNSKDGLTNEQRAIRKLLNISDAAAKDFSGSSDSKNLHIDMPTDYRAVRTLNKYTLTAIGYNKGTASVLSMGMTKRMGVASIMHPIQQLRNSTETKLETAINTWMENRRTTINVNDNVYSNIESDPNRDADNTIDPSTTTETDNTLASDVNSVSSLKSVEAAKASPNILAAVLCVANAISVNYDKLQHLNVVIPAIIMAHELISVGTQIRAGVAIANSVAPEANDLLLALGLFSSLLNKDQTDPTGSKYIKKGFWQYPAIQAISGTPISSTIRIPDELRGVGNKKNVPKFIDSNATTSTCKFLGSPVGIVAQIGMEVLLTKGSGSLIMRSITAAGGELKESVTTDPLINMVIKMTLGAIAGQTLNAFAGGATHAGYVSNGALWAENSKNVSIGATDALTDAQSAAWLKHNRQNRLEEQTQKSFAQKVLDPTDAYSLAGRTIRQVDPDIKSNLSNIASGFMNLSSTLSSLGSNLFNTKSAYAAYGLSDAVMAETINLPIDYALPLDYFSDEEYNFYGDNHEQLATHVKNILDENKDNMKEKIETCTGNRVIQDTEGNWTLWTAPMPSDDEDLSKLGINVVDLYSSEYINNCGDISGIDSNDSNTMGATTTSPDGGTVLASVSINDWRAIQAWILADVTSNQGNCVENGDEESCALVGAGGTPPTAIPATDTTTGGGAAPYIEGDLAWPSPGYGITSAYGIPRTFGGVTRIHIGVDIDQGDSSNAVALHAGDIKAIYPEGSCPGGQTGSCLLLTWTDSEGEWEAYYNHQGALPGITAGTSVAVGQPISVYNHTGITTGSHIHLQMYKNGDLVDPTSVIGHLEP